MKKTFWNVPNVLSLIRLALVPTMLLCFFLIPGQDHLVAMIIFVVASLTDALDGFIARSTHQITQYGVVLDPLADKLLKISTLVAFAIVGIIPYWLMGVLIFIDLGMIITGACLFKRKITIPSNIFGKLGTVVITIGLLMCFFDGTLNPWDIYVLYLGMIIVVASLVVYILLNYKRVFFPNKVSSELQKRSESEQQSSDADTADSLLNSDNIDNATKEDTISQDDKSKEEPNSNTSSNAKVNSDNIQN